MGGGVFGGGGGAGGGTHISMADKCRLFRMHGVSTLQKKGALSQNELHYSNLARLVFALPL